MKNEDFLNENLGHIYEYNGLFVEVVGYLDDYPRVINIVRYLSPDKARGRAEGWAFFDRRDKIEKGYDTTGSVYSYVLPRYLKQVSEADAVQAFAEAYKGEKFSLNGDVVTVVSYSTAEVSAGAGKDAVIVSRTHGGWRMVADADFILGNGEQKTFDYIDYRNLKPIGK